jgi:hypothetical protein
VYRVRGYVQVRTFPYPGRTRYVVHVPGTARSKSRYVGGNGYGVPQFRVRPGYSAAVGKRTGRKKKEAIGFFGKSRHVGGKGGWGGKFKTYFGQPFLISFACLLFDGR